MLESLRPIMDSLRPAPNADTLLESTGAGLPAVPPGERVYAIGDVHGRLDLFESMIAAIEADDAGRPPAETTVILLGDLIDRGPDSAGVIDRARSWAAERRVRALSGNHEEMLRGSLVDAELMRHFLRIGGKQTILSYAITPGELGSATREQLMVLLRERLPEDHLAFLAGMEDAIRIGDYLFVHAGIRPGIACDEQHSSDLRWIREPFLSHDEPHDVFVIHGHTITTDVAIRSNRIGIDTGAYRTGRLTAIGLESTDRWFIEVALPVD